MPEKLSQDRIFMQQVCDRCLAKYRSIRAKDGRVPLVRRHESSSKDGNPFDNPNTRFVADFEKGTEAALGFGRLFQEAVEHALRAPRLKRRALLFRLHLCEGRPFREVRAKLDIPEGTFYRWESEAREIVGQELWRRGFCRVLPTTKEPTLVYFMEGGAVDRELGSMEEIAGKDEEAA